MAVEAVNQAAEQVAAYLAQYESARDTLSGVGLGWLEGQRDAAIERFRARGFPTRRDEAWRYTDLRRAMRTVYQVCGAPAKLPSAEALAPFIADTGGPLIVLVDGHFAPSLSSVGDLPVGVTVSSLAGALSGRPETVERYLGRLAGEGADSLSALNTALMNDGAVVDIGANVVFDEPIRILHVATGGQETAARHTRILIALGANSQATVTESYAGLADGAGWSNTVIEMNLDRGARLRHFRLQAEGPAALHTSALYAGLARDARYDGFTMASGASMARMAVDAELAGEGAVFSIGGVGLLRGRQHLDMPVTVDHAMPHGTSTQTFRGVLEDRAHWVFQGRIHVHPDAQKTDAHQLTKTLLLSRQAESVTKPELEIHADDVKCSHGATVGELSADALFYLRSRGIPPAEARHLLIEAFIAELADSIGDEPVRALYRRHLAAWLPGAESLKDVA